jgi:two-component system sensor histidine kinase YesM
MIFFFLLAAVPLFIVGSVSYYKSFKAVEEISVESYSQVADQLNKSIELLFRDAEKYLTMGASEEAVTFLRQKSLSPELYDASYELIKKQKEYRDIFQFGSYINGIYIIGFNSFAISERRGLYRAPAPQDFDPFLSRIVDGNGATIIRPHSRLEYAAEPRDKDVISLGRVIEKPVTLENVGLIIVDIDLSIFQDLCQNLSIGNAGEFYVVARDRQILYPTDAYPIETFLSEGLLPEERVLEIRDNSEGAFFQKVDGVDEFYVFNTLEKTGWKIVGRVERQDLMESAYQIRSLSFRLIFVNLLFFFFIYLLVSRALTRPILNLKQVMKQAEEGNFDVRASSKGHDEITSLSHSFNAMIRKIKELMQLTIEEHEALKKYEMKALQAQINPHFLYNSLDAIIWMAEAGKKEDVVHITKSLSSFFRVSLSKGEEWIPVEDEVSHIRHYLEIQQIRYRDLLRFTIDVPEELKSLIMLKIVLQPLVENALYHGIKNKRFGGTISIGASRRANRLHFIIEDDGAGISEERLSEIRGALEDASKTIDSPGGFGMKNTYQRLKLYYKEDVDLLIKSRKGEGTRVELILPVKESLC